MADAVLAHLKEVGLEQYAPTVQAVCDSIEELKFVSVEDLTDEALGDKKLKKMAAKLVVSKCGGHDVVKT
jgi:hypothetical protein